MVATAARAATAVTAVAMPLATVASVATVVAIATVVVATVAALAVATVAATVVATAAATVAAMAVAAVAMAAAVAKPRPKRRLPRPRKRLRLVKRRPPSSGPPLRSTRLLSVVKKDRPSRPVGFDRRGRRPVTPPVERICEPGSPRGGPAFFVRQGLIGRGRGSLVAVRASVTYEADLCSDLRGWRTAGNLAGAALPRRR